MFFVRRTEHIPSCIDTSVFITEGWHLIKQVYLIYLTYRSVHHAVVLYNLIYRWADVHLSAMRGVHCLKCGQKELQYLYRSTTAHKTGFRGRLLQLYGSPSEMWVKVAWPEFSPSFFTALFKDKRYLTRENLARKNSFQLYRKTQELAIQFGYWNWQREENILKTT